MKYNMLLIFLIFSTRGARFAESLQQVESQALQLLDDKSDYERLAQRESVLSAEVASLEKKRDELRTYLNEKDKQLKDFEVLLEEKERTLKHVKEQLDYGDRKLREAEAAIKDKNTLITSFQHTKEWLNEQLVVLQRIFDTLCKDMFGVRSETAKLYEKTHNLSQKIEQQKDASTRVNEKALEDVKVAQTERALLEQEYNNLIKRDELHQQCKQDVHSLNELHKQCLISKGEVEHQTYQFEIENKQLRAKLANMSDELEVTRKNLQECANRHAVS